jgi:hypothetical protein
MARTVKAPAGSPAPRRPGRFRVSDPTYFRQIQRRLRDFMDLNAEKLKEGQFINKVAAEFVLEAAWMRDELLRLTGDDDEDLDADDETAEQTAAAE